MRTQEQINQWKANRNLSTAEVIERLPQEIKGAAYVVGAWVWIETYSAPDPEIREQLKALGFIWNKARGVWQHPCGVFRPKSHRDPREYYGIQSLEEDAR